MRIDELLNKNPSFKKFEKVKIIKNVTSEGVTFVPGMIVTILDDYKDGSYEVEIQNTVDTARLYEKDLMKC